MEWCHPRNVGSTTIVRSNGSCACFNLTFIAIATVKTFSPAQWIAECKFGVFAIFIILSCDYDGKEFSIETERYHSNHLFSRQSLYRAVDRWLIYIRVLLSFSLLLCARLRRRFPIYIRNTLLSNCSYGINQRWISESRAVSEPILKGKNWSKSISSFDQQWHNTAAAGLLFTEFAVTWYINMVSKWLVRQHLCVVCIAELQLNCTNC